MSAPVAVAGLSELAPPGRRGAGSRWRQRLWRRSLRPPSWAGFRARRLVGAIDARTTRHVDYAVSQIKRKLVEEGLGWGKVIGGFRKLHHRGRETVGGIFAFTNAAYNLVRMRTLIGAGVCA